MSEAKRCLVTGAGGFIGHHLVNYLKAEGHFVRGVDLKEPEYEASPADEFQIKDLRVADDADDALKSFGQNRFDRVYMLAADMGGMGFISQNHADIIWGNSLINLNTIDAVKHYCPGARVFFASSACVYPEYKQLTVDCPALKETDAWPAQPDTAYGLEKLFTEQVLIHHARDFGLEVRIARFHNIYGELGTWTGGREKAPAAVCRKIAEARIAGKHHVEVWGDGKATRSYMHVSDCVEGIDKLVESEISTPLNLGSDRNISVDGLYELVSDLAGWPVNLVHIDGPQGVRGRNSDNALCETLLRWRPKLSLERGLAQTYQWIEEQVRKSATVCSATP